MLQVEKDDCIIRRRNWHIVILLLASQSRDEVKARQRYVLRDRLKGWFQGQQDTLAMESHIDTGRKYIVDHDTILNILEHIQRILAFRR